MAQFHMSTIKIDEIVIHKARGTSSFTTSVIFGDKTPRKTIEARKVSDIVPHLQNYEKELATTYPDTCFRIFVDIEKGFRKPPGFDAATKRGGPLYDRFSNPEVVTVYRD
jgi:hypothetical protein